MVDTIDVRGSTVVGKLLRSREPSVRYRAHTKLLGRSPMDPEMLALREEIRRCARARRLLSEVGDDGTITHDTPLPTPVYEVKFRGTHWVLLMLAEIDYPPGDSSLRPLVEQVRPWALHYGEICKTIKGRVRRCASQEGNAILYLLKLGFHDETVDELARRLIRWQWPGGGWNCDVDPEATHASFHESLVPLRALIAYAAATGDRASKSAATQAAEMFLERRLFRRKSTGQIIRPRWTKTAYPCFYHYSFFHGLRAMAEGGFIGDPRCEAALDLLESKRLPGGGFPCETAYSSTATTFKARGGRGRCLVDWGPEDPGRMNEWVTAEALYILKAAGRLA